MRWVFKGHDIQFQKKGKETTDDKEPWQTYYEGQDDIVEYLMERYKGFLSMFGYQIEYQGGHLDLVGIDKNIRAKRTMPRYG